jgi:hypothetical protein
MLEPRRWCRPEWIDGGHAGACAGVCQPAEDNVSAARLPETVAVSGKPSTAGGTVGRLIELADQALYAAKAAGRNCVRNTAAGGEPPARQGADTADALG